MRTLWKLSLLLLLTATFAVDTVHVDARGKKKKDDEDSAESDPFRLVKIAGRQWLLKREPKAGNEGGDTSTTFHKFEVLNVYDDKADLAQSTLDSARKPTSQEDFVIKVKFEEDALYFKDPVGFNKGKTETIKVPAGKFKCVRWTRNSGDDGDVSLWRSVDFPGLIVKQDSRFGMRELVEFTWVDGDPGYKSKKKKDDPEEIEKTRLFKTKGARWIHKTTTEKGERKIRSFEVVQYEVTAVGDEESEVEVTQMSQLLKQLEDTEVETKVIKFDDTLIDHLEPMRRFIELRTEQRICETGLYTCTVYSYKTEDGRDALEWYANEWPGLIVRRVITSDEYKQVMELIEFEE